MGLKKLLSNSVGLLTYFQFFFFYFTGDTFNVLYESRDNGLELRHFYNNTTQGHFIIKHTGSLYLSLTPKFKT